MSDARPTVFSISREFEAFFADLFPSLEQGFGGTYDQLAAFLKTAT